MAEYDIRRGSSYTESAGAGDTKAGADPEPATVGTSDGQSGDLSTAEILIPGAAEYTIEEFHSAVKDGETVGTWIEIWDLLMGALGEASKQGMDAVKKTLISIIDLLQSFIDMLKELVKIAAAIAGYLLETASMAIALAKAALKFFRELLDMLLTLLEIPILKSELKMAYFSLFAGLDPSKLDAMGPVVAAKLDDMVTTWMNRPVAESQLCMLMFIPLALPKEVAESAGTGVRFKDLVSKTWKDFMKSLDSSGSSGGGAGQANRLIEIIETVQYVYTSRNYQYDGEVTRDNIQALLREALPLAEGVLAEAEGLPLILEGLFNTVREAEEAVARSAITSLPSETIPGILTMRCREGEKGGCLVETNFMNGQYRYLSSIYRLIGGTGVVEPLFRDPSFALIKAASSDEYSSRVTAFTALFNVIRRWMKDNPGRGYGLEEDLTRVLNNIVIEMAGAEQGGKLLSRLSDPSEALVALAVLGHSVEGETRAFKEAVKEYRKQSGKVTGLDYPLRSSVNPDIPLFQSEINIKSGASEGDVLLFVFDTSDCRYVSADFVEKGIPGVPVAGHNLTAASNLMSGTFEASAGTLMLTTYVQASTYPGLEPRWYGVATPPGVNSWTGSKLINTIMPEQFLDAMEALYQRIEDMDSRLEKYGESVNDAKKKMKAIVDMINRYFKMLDDLTRSVKNMIQGMSLSDLPTVYVAVWRGGAEDIPGIVSTALTEKQWFNSTYGGVLLFGAESGIDTLLEAWYQYEQAAESGQNLMDYLRQESEAFGELSVDALASIKKSSDNIVKLGSDMSADVQAIGDITIPYFSEINTGKGASGLAGRVAVMRRQVYSRKSSVEAGAARYTIVQEGL